jgi:hypothetical protein
MEHGISEIYGEGLGPDGRATPVYRALRELLCSACGAQIVEGSLFTRKSLPQFALRIMPRCRECAPFAVAGDTEGVRPAGGPVEESDGVGDETPEGAGARRSKLLEGLLTPAPEAGGAQKVPERPRDVSEEVARRLGPALSRSRRGRS